MSFEITCAFFQNGAETDVARHDVMAPFQPFVELTEETLSRLRFPDGGEAELTIDNALHIDNFIVRQPPDEPAFWTALFQILQKFPGAVFCDGGPLAVAQSGMVAQIGADMVEAFGTPQLIATADALRALFSGGA
jgi:hypothetical protein